MFRPEWYSRNELGKASLPKRFGETGAWRYCPRLESLETRWLLSAGGAAATRLAAAYGQIPLSFEANQGETAAQVRFLSRGDGYALFLTPTQAVLNLSKPVDAGAKGQAQPAPVEGTALFMQLVGANPAATIAGEEPLPGTSNYFIGNDPRQWHTAIPTYGRVAYHDVYPGIDLVYYGNQRQLEYDFTVRPGADAGTIELAFQGTDRLALDGQGNLVLHTAGGDVVEHAPVVYQGVAGAPQPVSGRYVLEGSDRVRFAVGAYDHRRPLVVDPVLSYSTYLGGSNFDRGFGIAVDASGSAYVTGVTTSSNFPTTAGAFQTSNHGYAEAFVTKLNTAGSALVYSTYLGGSGGDIGDGIAVDASGSAYVTGYTRSTDFPTTAGAFQTTKRGGGYNAFVTKLNAAGSALVYSTYLGGSGGLNGDSGNGLAVDAAGSAYVTGRTASTDFPTTAGAFQTTKRGGSGTYNAFVTKLNAAGMALAYSTYLGGSGADYGDTGYGIAVDTSGSAYVTGTTSSTDFPTTAGAFQTTNHGVYGADNAFVTKVNAGGSALVYSTYLGGSAGENGAGIAVDASGSAYVIGTTGSTDFPTTAGAFQTINHCPSPGLDGGGGNGFVTKLNAAGTALAYSTYLGGSGNYGCSYGDSAVGIAVDASGNAYVTGTTFSTDFPTTPGAFQTTNHYPGGSNAFVTKLNAAGTDLAYSSYLGGSDFVSASGIAVDAGGSAYVTGEARRGFPTTAGAFQTTNHSVFGAENAFVAKLTFPEAATHFSVSAPAGAAAGVPFSVTVTALDANNNVVTGYTGTVHFTSADPYGATLPADYTFTAADHGVHTFPAAATLYTAGTWDVTATDTSNPTLTGSANVTVTPAALDHFLIATSVDGSSTTAGVPFDVTVTAQDAYNNTVTSYTRRVHFSSGDPYSATLPPDYRFQARDRGRVTFAGGATLHTAGTWDVTATDTTNGAAGSDFVTVTPAPAVQFVIIAPTTVVAGMAFDFSVAAIDPYGNTGTNYTGSVVFSTIDPAGTFNPTGYTFQSSDLGTATFPMGAALNTVGTWDITATDSNNGITGSSMVIVTASGPPEPPEGRSALAVALAGTIYPGGTSCTDQSQPEDLNYIV
jgi:hypothetical protein